MAGRYSARGVDKDPGWVERRFRELNQAIGELRVGKISTVPGSTVTITQLLTDPASVIQFSNTDTATVSADDATTLIALSHVPLPESLHVRKNGLDLKPSEWSLSGQLLTVAPSTDVVVRAGDVFTTAYAYDTVTPPASTSAAYLELMASLGPLVYPRLVDASGTTLTDYSGNGRDGTISAGIALGASGLVPNLSTATSGDFSGTGILTATIPYGSWMDVSTIALKAWVNADTLSGTDHAIVARDYLPGTRAFNFYITSTGLLNFVFWTGSGIHSATGSTVLSTGTRYMVGAKYDGTTAKVFINGVEDASTTTSGSLVTGAGDMTVGCALNASGGNPTWDFDGRIQELAMFTSLADTDFADLYTVGMSS